VVEDLQSALLHVVEVQPPVVAVRGVHCEVVNVHPLQERIPEVSHILLPVVAYSVIELECLRQLR